MDDYLEFKDYLCFRRDKEIKDLIKEEQLLFSDKIKGLYFFTVERNLVITNEALYILEEKSNLIFSFNL